MKTKAFLLLFLLLGIGFTQLSAQAPSTGKGTVIDKFTWNGYSIPVFCNGAIVDNLEGNVTVIEIIRYGKNGQWLWATHFCYGAVSSTSGSGEVFKISEFDTPVQNGAPTQTIIVLAIGNKGSQFLMTLVYNPSTYELIPVRTTCH